MTDRVLAPQQQAFGALTAIFGQPTDKHGNTLIGALAVKVARDGDLEGQIERYFTQFTDCALTPSALLKWWDWLRSPAGSMTREGRVEWLRRRGELRLVDRLRHSD